MYLHIGRNQMLAERRIIGIFDLEITSQSKTTRAFLDRAQQEGTVLEICDDLPKSFLVCDHPYHPQIVYLSELSSQTLQKEWRNRHEDPDRPVYAVKSFSLPHDERWVLPLALGLFALLAVFSAWRLKTEEGDKWRFRKN